jgi:hypothetical protein
MNTKRPKPRRPLLLWAFLCVLLAGGHLAWTEARRDARETGRQALPGLHFLVEAPPGLAEEVEAAQRARIAAMAGVRREAEARGEDGIAAAEKFLDETREAHREELKGTYAKHGRQPPAWLRDPQSLHEP